MRVLDDGDWIGAVGREISGVCEDVAYVVVEVDGSSSVRKEKLGDGRTNDGEIMVQDCAGWLERFLGKDVVPTSQPSSTSAIELGTRVGTGKRGTSVSCPTSVPAVAYP